MSDRPHETGVWVGFNDKVVGELRALNTVAAPQEVDVVLAEEPSFGVTTVLYQAERSAVDPQKRSIGMRIRRRIESVLEKLNPPQGATVYDVSETQFPDGGLGGFSLTRVRKSEDEGPSGSPSPSHLPK